MLVAGRGALLDGLTRIRAEAEDAVRSGAGHLVLSDHGQGEGRIAMPMILATSAVHCWLTRKGLRTFSSLNVRSAECVDAHYFAVLIGCGATVVNAYLAEDSIADRIGRGLLDGSLTENMARYRYAIDQGLLKIMAKMGISVVSSYRGGLNFEAVGLSRALVAEYFPGMHSRISGIGLKGIQHKLEAVHRLGWQSASEMLPVGGFYKSRASGETHAWESQAMHMMQAACARASFEMWKQYSAKMRANPPIHLRDLLDFKPIGKAVQIEEVESITSIRKRFVTPGMSLGALSPEAHKTLNVAMNRIGAKSDSGEGGEDPANFHPEPNGDNPSAKRQGARQLVLDLGVVKQQPFFHVHGQHLPRTQGALFHHARLIHRHHPGLGTRHHQPVAGHHIAHRTQPTAVHPGAHPAPVGHRQRCRSVPRLHHRIAVRIHVAPGLRQFHRLLAPAFRHHHRLGHRR